MPQDNIKLIAIVQVDKKDRIICQSENCKHTVYKQIHVLFDGIEFKLVGVSCFQKNYQRLIENGLKPVYSTSTGGRLLTDEERQLLVENTARLIALFKTEFEAKERVKKALEEREAQEKERFLREKVNRTMGSIIDRKRQASRRSIESFTLSPTDIYDKDRWDAAWKIAADNLQPEYPGQDLNAPWFSSVMRIEATRIYKESKK